MIGISCASAMVVVDEEALLSKSSVTVALLMDADTYSKGVSDYDTLQAGGSLSATGEIPINWVNQPGGNQFSVTTSEDGESLVLKAPIPTEGDENN
jgi:hypothetical protein